MERKEFKTIILNYRKDGQPFWNELKISPVFSDEGELLYFVGIQADISNRRTVERMKDEFVSVVSHELRTPHLNSRCLGLWRMVSHPTGRVNACWKLQSGTLTVCTSN